MDPFKFHRMMDAERAEQERAAQSTQEQMELDAPTEWAESLPHPFPPMRSVREKDRARQRFRQLRNSKGR